jgi:hypothetical protein
MKRIATVILSSFLVATASMAADRSIGLGAKPVRDAEVIIDGTRKLLDEKWT